MSSQETRGAVKKMKGSVKEAVGIVTANKKLENAGARQRAESEVQQTVGKERRKVSELAADLADTLKK